MLKIYLSSFPTRISSKVNRKYLRLVSHLAGHPSRLVKKVESILREAVATSSARIPTKTY